MGVSGSNKITASGFHLPTPDTPDTNTPDSFHLPKKRFQKGHQTPQKATRPNGRLAKADRKQSSTRSEALRWQHRLSAVRQVQRRPGWLLARCGKRHVAQLLRSPFRLQTNKHKRHLPLGAPWSGSMPVCGSRLSKFCSAPSQCSIPLWRAGQAAPGPSHTLKGKPWSTKWVCDGAYLLKMGNV